MNTKLKIGLALGSGGPRGFAIVGVLKTLRKYGIEIDYIAGSSIGSIVGGAYAVDKNIKKIEELALSLKLNDIVGVVTDPGKKGLFQGNKFLDIIKSYAGDQKIENTIIPFTAVATDKRSGTPVLIDHGSLAEAMRASSSVPVFFEPYSTTDSELLDGGVSQQVPVRAVQQMGADFVIAVNLTENMRKYEGRNKILEIQHYLYLLEKNLAAENCQSADIVLSPTFEDVSWKSNFEDRQALIAEGERVTEERIPEILEMIKTARL